MATDCPFGWVSGDGDGHADVIGRQLSTQRGCQDVAANVYAATPSDELEMVAGR